MTAEELLIREFDRLSEAPGAVEKLRAFVYDLAVRGKLAASPASGGSAERESASREMRFLLPAGWRWIRFGEVHDLVRGVSYTKSDLADGPTPTHLPVLRAGNIGASLTFDEPVHVHRRCVAREQLLRSGDYVIAMSSGSKALVGKAAFVEHDVEYAFGAFCGAIRITQPKLIPFVGIFLSSPLYRDAIAFGSRGIGINNLRRETLNGLWFPLPPERDQEETVRRVDQLNRLISQLEAAQVERERRREGAGRAASRLVAVEGRPSVFTDHFDRLIADVGHIGTVQSAVERLALSGRLTQRERAPVIECKRGASQRDTELPCGWKWETIGGVVRSLRYGTSVKCTYASGGTPVLRIPNVSSGRITVDDLKFGILRPREAEELRLQPADVLVIRSNGSLNLVGRAVAVDPSCTGFCYAGYLIRLRPDTEVIDPKYLAFILGTQPSRQQIEVPIRSAVGLKNVNAAELSKIRIPLPPLAEQQQIVLRVTKANDAVNDLIAASEERSARQTLLLDTLMQACLNSVRPGPSPPHSTPDSLTTPAPKNRSAS